MRKRGLAFLMSAAMVLSLLMGVPATSMKVQAATAGGFTVEGGTSGVDYEYDSTNGKLIIKTGTALEIRNTDGTSKLTTDSICIDNNVSANLTLAGVNINTRNVGGSGIEIPEGSTGNVTIKISGYNIVASENAPGIKKNGTTGMLTIDDVDSDDADDDELAVISRSSLDSVSVGAAAIGGESGKTGGNITINGGLIMAFAASRGAVIGGGAQGNGSNITINGGTVKAIGFNHSSMFGNVEIGAAIGGGYDADGTNITINGGTVEARFLPAGNYDYAKYISGTANSVRGGAAIGGGYNGSASNITITGGTITAEGGTGINGAAAIGAGSYGGATGIKITGGHITATGGGTIAAAIGSGEQEVISNSSDIKSVDITITGGTIVATGGINAPGIGAGQRANAYVYISGGSINAKSGGTAADSIGFGSEQKSSTLYRKNVVYSVAEKDTTSDKVTLTSQSYKGSANTDVEGKISFRYTADGTEYNYNTNDMKTDASGYIYAYLPSGVEIYEKTADGELKVLYNDNATLQDCYGGPVSISANGYKVSNAQNGTYDTTYTINKSGTYTLYFKGNVSGEITTKSITVKIDNTPPTAMISIGSSNYQTVNTITAVQSYILSSNTVTIYYSDTSGVQSVQYGFASQCYNEASIEANVPWTTVSGSGYSTSFTGSFSEAKAIYAKVTDNMGNVTYVSTPIIYNDATAPENTVSVTSATADSATISIRVTDESDAEYAYVVLPATESAPTDWTSLVNKITTTNGGQGTCLNGSETITKTVSGLTAGTAYKVYVISKNALTDLSNNAKENVGSIATDTFTTSKMTANVSDEEFVIKSGVSTTSYTYDLKSMLAAAGVDVSNMTNLQYSCTTNNGSILSTSGTLNVNNGVVTIPVYANLAEDLSQDITVTFTSDNFEPISATLTVATVGKTTVALSGVSVSNVVYDGNQHPYSGTIQWMANGVQCAGSSDTVVTYVGINGTNYSSSTTAPTNAGTYQVNFAINDNNADYKGNQSYTFEIKKANLTDAMSNVAWYMDGTNRIYSSDDAKVTENGNTHQVQVKGYPEDKVTPQYSGTYSSSVPGTYTATVTFNLTASASANYNAPQSMTLDWEIVDRITPDMSSVRWVYKQGTTQNAYTEGSTNLYVNGASYTVEVTGLPEGVTASYSGTCEASAAGDYSAYVTFAVTDSTKYKAPTPASMSLSWSIDKNTAYVSGQTYLIKSSASTNFYEYDVNDLLEASGLNASMFNNLQYTCTKSNGNILSGDPSINSQGIMTIPVYTYLNSGLTQDITVTFTSDNYETITTTLNVETMEKTPVTLTGVSVSDVVYDGNKHPYSGTIQWVADGTPCVDMNGTDVTYVGVDGTNYPSSTTAPTDAGTYQVTFTVKSNNTDYIGTQSYTYTIAKASLAAEMANVAWYLDGTRITSADDAKVTENGSMHQVSVQGYPTDKVTPQYGGTYGASAAGYYTATVSFELTDSFAQNYNAPESMTLNWQVVDRITPDMSSVRWVYKQGATQNTYTEGSTNLYVNGQTYTVEVTGLPEGVTANYSGTREASAAGNYSAYVTFAVTDSTKYKNPEPSYMSLSWSINKNTAYVSGQTYSIKAGESTTSYEYDVNALLTASGLNASMFDNLTYVCAKDNGSILSSNPTVNKQGIMTIPVYSNLGENNSQNITVTFKSDNYTDMNAVLTIRTISQSVTQVSLTGVTVGNKVYNGQAQGYTGEIVWKDNNGTAYVYEDGTEVTYIGVNGTTYNSTSAPTDAGTYQVVFSVEDTSKYIGHATYQYTISPVDLSNEMTNIQWCIDGTEVDVDNAKVLYDGNVHTVSIANYPNAYVTPVYVNHQKIALGQYTTVVNFEVNELYEGNYYVPASIHLDWEIVEELEEVVEKITPDMSKVKWVYKQDATQSDYNKNSTKLIANGKTYTVEVTGVPEGVTVQYSGVCKASAAGTYMAMAIFGITDSEKYNQPSPSSMALEWRIEEPEKTVTPLPAIGKPVTYDNGNYKVTSATENGGTVEYTGPTGKKASLKEVKIPTTIVVDGKSYAVTTIAKNALSGYKKLTKVTIPNGITSIGANAFKGCVKLTKVTIPNSVTSIGSGAFSGCKKLKTVSIKNSSKLTTIGDKAFYKCTALTKFTVTKNVTTIGKQSFFGCKKLKTITIKSKKLKKVGTKAIKGIYKKATIKCPGKTYVTKYKKLFKSKTGFTKSMKLKK